MMKKPEQTIEKLIDKQSVSFIASISADGLPLKEDITAIFIQRILRFEYIFP